MSDPVYHDAQFAGSPLISYGEAPAKKRIPKLLAFLAGSFVLVLLGVFTWFWVFTSVEVPAEPMLMAIVPAGFVLPPETPELWRNTAENNDPLPTILGFVENRIDGKAIPFAVRVISVSDLFRDGPHPVWSLISAKGNLGRISKLTPMKIFGNPFKSTGKQAWLSLDPSMVIGTDQEKLALPSRMEGLFDGKIWEVNMPIVDTSEQVPTSSLNLVTISGRSNGLLANYSLTNGIIWQLPEASWLAWRHQTSTLDMIIYPSPFLPSSSTIMEMASSDELLSRQSLLLADETDYFEFQPPSPSTSTQGTESQQIINFHIPQNLIWSAVDETVSPSTCPGKTVAVYDALSLKNICSWIDICFIKPTSLVVSQQGGKTFFCIK